MELCNKEICSGCNACVAVCKHDAISMIADEEGFLQPNIFLDKCVECGLCRKTCPILSPLKAPDHSHQKLYALHSKDKLIRRRSTSGGFFSVISKEIIDGGGKAVGVVLNDDLKIAHLCIDDTDEIYRFSGSKYVQSDLQNCFRQVEQCLQSGHKCVFSGTPCQVAGLLSFLKHPYLDLNTVEVVCHGVPSPLFWEQYIKHKENEYKSKIVAVNFRDKKYGYGSGVMKLVFSNGKVYHQGHEADYFLHAFSKSMIDRRSCYSCHFKGMEKHYADFTIYDGWHICKWNKKMNDDKGTTLVYAHNEKAQCLLNKISNNFVIQEVSVNDKYAKIDAVMLYRSSIMTPQRNNIYQLLNNNGFDGVVDKYLSVTWKIRFKSFLKQFLYHIRVLSLFNRFKKFL